MVISPVKGCSRWLEGLVRTGTVMNSELWTVSPSHCSMSAREVRDVFRAESQGVPLGASLAERRRRPMYTCWC